MQTATLLQRAGGAYIILSLLKNIDDSNIANGKINEENLLKYNVANILALKLFKGIRKHNFEKPEKNRSFAQTFLYCENLSIEEVDNIHVEKKDTFLKFMSLVDSFDVSPMNENLICISYSVDDVFEQQH
jgi:hypothetical protein